MIEIKRRSKLSSWSSFIRIISKFAAPTLIFMSLGAWALVSPVGSSPDDDFHLASIWCANDGFPGMCEQAQNTSEREVSGSLLRVSCFAGDSSVSAACQTQAGVLEDRTLLTSSRGNFSALYPPVYYSFMHLFASENVEASVIVMRFVTIALFVALLSLVWISAPQKMSLMQRIPWLITSVPLGVFIIASNNPSSWAFIGVGVGFLALYGFLTAPPSWPRWKITVLVTVFLAASIMAAGSRGDAAIFLLIGSVSAVALSFSLSRRYVMKLLVLLIPLLMGLFFFLLASQASSLTTGGFGAPSPSRSALSVLINNIFNFPSLYFGIFGGWGLGWIDTWIPLIVPSVLLIVFVGYLVLAWQFMTRYQILLQLVFFAVIIAMPIYILQLSLQVVGESLQPRYLLPLVLLLALASVQALNIKGFEGKPFFKYFVWVALSGGYAVSIYVNMVRYVYGSDQIGNLPINSEWWWSSLNAIHPIFIVALGASSFSVLVFILIRPWQESTDQSFFDTSRLRARGSHEAL